jgi:ABC-type amino acid transport substrate-binding protein
MLMKAPTRYAMPTVGATAPEVRAGYIVIGKTLAHSRKAKSVAAQHLGYEDLHKPTLRQSALLHDVSVALVQHAMAALKSGQATAVIAGTVSLADAAAKARPAPLPKPTKLFEALKHASDTELAEAGHIIGVTKIWDRMISPNV